MDLKLDLKLALTPELRQMGLRAALGAALLVLVVFLALVMPLREGRRLEAETAQTRERTKRQQALLPAWATLSQFAQNATIAALLPPATVPAERARVYTVPDELSQMARALGVEPVDVTLNPASLAQNPNAIEVNGIFAGQIEGLRGLLGALAGLPSLAGVDKAEIRAVDGHLELYIQLRIALGG